MGGRDGLKREAVFIVVLAGIAFSTSGPFARLAHPADPMLIAFGRVLVAAVLLFAADVRGVVRSVRGLTGRQRVATAGAGALLAVHFWLFLWGLTETSFPAAMSLISLEPLAVVLCAWVLFRIRPSRAEQVGVIVATTGALVVSRGAGAGEHRLFGDLLVIGAVVLFGLYIAAARGLRDTMPARHYATLVYAAASVTLLPAVLASPSLGLGAVLELPAHSLMWIFAIGVVPTVIGHTMVQAAARRLSPAIVALVSPGETLGAIAIGVVVLGAVPTGVELAGAIIIVVGVAWAILRGRAPDR